MITIAALIDKIARHYLRRNLGVEETYSIVDPLMYLMDIYNDMSLQEKTEADIYQLYDMINNMDSLIDDNAPVHTVCGKKGDVKLFKSDIKKLDDLSDDGLSRVDNTPDDSKPPSNPFKESWLYTYTNMIVPAYNRMNDQIYGYRIHVTGDGSSPIKNNPHNDLLTAGIWYNGEIIYLNPDTFLHRQYLTDHVSDHNADGSAHQVIQDITKPIIGGEAPGTLYREVQALSDREVAFSARIVPTFDSTTQGKIELHNTDLNAHQYIQDAIQYEGNDHLGILFQDTEKDIYEYQKYRVNSISNGTYTKEYPSVYAVTPLLPKEKAGISFTDPTHIPSAEFRPNDKIIRVRTTDGSVHDVPIQGKTGGVGLASTDYDMNYASMGPAPDLPVFVAFARSGDIAYQDDRLNGYRYFTIDFKGDNGAITCVGYEKDPLDRDEIDAKYLFSHTGVFFSEYGVTFYKKFGGGNIAVDFRYVELSGPEAMKDEVVTTDPSFIDPDNRILKITKPDNYYSEYTEPIQMQTIDFDSQPTTDPIRMGQLEGMPDYVSYASDESSGESLPDGCISYGIQIDEMPVSGTFRFGFNGDIFNTSNAKVSFSAISHKED